MFVLDNLGREIQEAGSLCWAAVSTMAVRAFPEEGHFRHPTQRETVIYHESGIFTVEQLLEAKKANGVGHEKYEAFKDACAETGSCNLTSTNLHLFDLKSVKVPAGQVLTAEHFFIEIAKRARPVMIRWRYLHEVEIDGRTRPPGEHALIVTGYNSITHQLRVFDPWPSSDPTDDIPDLPPALHEKWIPFDVYIDPQNDHGLDAVAMHKFDQYMLQRVKDNENLKQRFLYPDPVAIPPRVARRENSVDFNCREIPDDLYGAIYKVMRMHVVRDSSGAVIHGPYDPGLPIPILALTVAQIVGAARNRDPAALFKSNTSTVAVPVLRNGEMIDSFLMLHDSTGWHHGGYCNNNIAALLLQARQIHAEKPDERRFYLVSIPELSAFFVAHGYFSQANIAGLSRTKLRHLRNCGVTLDEVIGKVQRDTLDLEKLRKSLGSSLC